MNTAPDLAGARVVVLGLGRFGGGLGVARWLLDSGASVLVTDRLPREVLAEPADELAARGAELVLGGHAGVDLGDADLLVVNPAVPLTAPLVEEARARDVVVTSEIALLMERWPGPVVGVTGSNGKSTTVGLLHALLEAAGVPAERGGNLGGSLLGRLGEVADGTVAVLELSSFMLELLGERGLGPEVAVLTNLTPNHLDRHGTMEAYREAKAAILRHARCVVLPVGDPWLAPLASRAAERKARVLWFGDRSAGGAAVAAGTAVAVPRRPDLGVDAGGHLVDRAGVRVLASEDVPLPGRMNRWNVAAAALAAGGLLDDPARALAALPGGLAAYRPPPHRLEQVTSRAGVRWVDDSVSTTPESTAASLEAVGGACLLIAGGRDKGLDARPLVEAARRFARQVLTVGEEGRSLAERLNRAGVPAEQLDTVPAAVARAAALASTGDTVLLSPGYSSHDQFAHFEERAAVFRAAVRDLERPPALS